MRLLTKLAAAALGLAALAAPALAQQQVRVGIIPVLGVSPILVVDKEGWAKEAGLDLKFNTFESGPLMIQALASGTLDVYVAGVAPLGVARSKGIDVRVVTATAVEEMTVAAGPKLASYFKDGVKPADALKAFHTATGKPARLATQPPGSVPHTTLVHWLQEVTKADKADYEVVPMGIDATQQALLSGAVDGGTIREPTDTIVQQRNKAIKIVALGGEMFPDQPGTVMAVSGDFLMKNPQGVQALVNGVVRAIDLIKSDPKRARARHRGGARQGADRHRHDHRGAEIARVEIRRQSDADRRGDEEDAGLPGLDRHARQGCPARRIVRRIILRQGQEVTAPP